MMVQSELEKLDIAYKSIELGEVQLEKPISKSMKLKLKKALHESELELMNNKNTILIERIINVIVKMVHYSDELPTINFSDFLNKKLQQDYHYLAEVFSQTKGITIEHFIIMHKIERVKELIIYDELSLTEISYKMQYSSVQHLSSQFKKTTGLTPTFFKNLKKQKRTRLENL
jgi:YesN/AraC family two-component response regulator